jgi:hypothetical protein
MEMECDFGVDKQLLKDLDNVDASAADNEDADAGTK